MAKNNFEKAYALLEVEKFSGIDRTATFGVGGECSEMRNFRVLSDGSLEKRCGFELSLELKGEIRALWSGALDDIDTVIAVVGCEVFNLFYDGDSPLKIGELLSEEGELSFFRMDGGLYIIDGVELYFCNREWVEKVGEGYVPLYGSLWTIHGGVMNEPINQLSKRIRLQYVIDVSGASFLETNLNIVSVDKLFINGKNYTSKSYVDGTRIMINGAVFSNGNYVDAVVSLDDSYFEREDLVSCCHATVYGGRYDNGVYCFGGADISRVFRSKYVGSTSLFEAKKLVPECCGLYFPLGYDFRVDDGYSEVRAISRHYDRLLIFSYNDTRMTDLADAEFRDIPVMPVNSGVGCIGHDSVAFCENDPITVSRDGIYRWTSNTDERDESNAQLVSLQIDGLMDEEFRRDAIAFNYRAKKEIWFGNPTDAEGRVFIYNYALGVWYCFDGIFADGFFACGGDVGFYSGARIYFFDDAFFTDCGREITAEFTSRYTHMGRSASKKRMQRCLAVGSGEGNYTLELYNDTERLVDSVHFTGKGGCAVDRQERILRTGRFSYIRYRILAGGSVRPRIYGITLLAGK